jgi:ParB family chromosome partitioning protein
MSTDKYLPYRGDVKAVAGIGGTLTFVTVHAENHPTAVYRLDADKLTLAADVLPAGGAVVRADGDILWVGGSNSHVYRASAGGGKPMALGSPLSAAPTALALLAGDRLAVLAGPAITVLSRADGRVLQTLEVPEAGACLAADPTGQWLVAGTAKGTVAVYDCEDKPEFLPGESARLHEGAVTALLFEPEELRFLSAGADQKLLSTHARGKLEPEDKGRGNMHTDTVTALIWGPGDRFYSGSKDGTVKAWPRAGNLRPVTLKDGVGKVVDLALVQVHTRPHLVAACDDNTLRFVLLDAAGKFGDLAVKVHDAYAAAQHELSQDESRRREPALRALAEYNDMQSIELLSERVGKDGDHGLRLLATQLLGDSGQPRAAKLLEKWLSHADEAVRVAALAGLRRLLGEQDLRPLDLALKTEKADVGQAAVQALEGLAARDDQALSRLTETLDAKTFDVRQAALTSLERVYGQESPEANLIALHSKHADLRRQTLVRLFQRKMLHKSDVQAAVRWRAEDPDAEVRRTAFLVSLYTRERLVKALRERDPELNRQLVELESGNVPASPAAKAKPAKPGGQKVAGTPPPPGPEMMRAVQAQMEELAREGQIPAQLLQQYAEQMKQWEKLGLSPGDPKHTSIFSILAAQLQEMIRRLRKPRED